MHAEYMDCICDLRVILVFCYLIDILIQKMYICC